ncbi:flagellar protein FliT [Paraburkholderia sp.]|uniref:flagellar protein FliT n=1 Tax=Paraburkholderia sp. TaxID=1926495 RepID=UPI002384341A|nr:flagellar protein FliT [Paraburkholderia sp.]MDE1181274.1 flagellar protein FliT [Paraburkholderia sp.]
MDQNVIVERLLSLTQDIEAAAFIADWPTAAARSAERAPLVRQLSPQQSPAALAMIRRIQAIDAQVMSSASVTRMEMEREFGTAMQRVSAVSQYQVTARL